MSETLQDWTRWSSAPARAATSAASGSASSARRRCASRRTGGGVCLNVGCIPSKALINAAKTYDKIAPRRRAWASSPTTCASTWRKHAGLEGRGGQQADRRRARSCSRATACDYRQGSATLRRAATTRRGQEARRGQDVRIEAERIVVATGSRPIEIPASSSTASASSTRPARWRFREVPAAPGGDRRRLHRPRARHAVRQARQPR